MDYDCMWNGIQKVLNKAAFEVGHDFHDAMGVPTNESFAAPRSTMFRTNAPLTLLRWSRMFTTFVGSSELLEYFDWPVPCVFIGLPPEVVEEAVAIAKDGKRVTSKVAWGVVGNHVDFDRTQYVELLDRYRREDAAAWAAWSRYDD